MKIFCFCVSLFPLFRGMHVLVRLYQLRSLFARAALLLIALASAISQIRARSKPIRWIGRSPIR